MTGAELALVKSALAETERVSRFGMEVLDDANNSQDAGAPENSRLRREIEALGMREASLRSLQKTLAELSGDGKLAAMQRADLDELTSGAALQLPQSR